MEMEKMIERESFRPLHRSDPHHMHEVIVAIPKLNIEHLEKVLEDRATPGSPEHLQWLSYDEISTLVVNENSYEKVMQWFHDNDLSVSWVSRRKDYLSVVAKISVWERLLQTEFFAFLDESLPERKVSLKIQGDSLRNDQHRIFHRAKTYSIPEDIRPHIGAIFNTVQAPPQFRKNYHRKNYRSKSGSPYRTNFRMQIEDGVTPDGSSTTDGVVTVSFLNSFYNISSNAGLPNAILSQAVFETGETYFSPSDLSKFQSTYCLPEQAAVSVGDHTIASCPTNPPTSAPDCFEGNLDIQYIMGISQQTVSVFWWVAGGDSGTSADPFLVWILAVADDVDPPKVNSISYGIAEYGESASVLSQFNTEAMLLSLQGVTITASSGDNGAPNIGGLTGNTCLCNFNSGSAFAPWASTVPATDVWIGQGYFPSFPASSPYVTAVGASMGPEVGDPEIACQSQLGGIITTGGGFSTYFSAPSWQQSAISTYFSELSTQGLHLSAGYNPNGRGYPDVSLIGVEYQVVVGGAIASVFGTSCSSPVFAAMISLLNAKLAHSGHNTTLGFLNIALWSAGRNSTSNPTKYGDVAFNDITSGHNKCCANQLAAAATCCSSGFYATTGWDPVTGWGSIQFDNLARSLGVSNLSMIPHAPVTCQSSSSSLAALSPGATAAVVIVVLVVVIGIVCCIFFGLCRRPMSSSLAEQEVVAAVPVVYVSNPAVPMATVHTHPQPSSN
jgi:tripeptidyl-peptidase-1